MLINVRNLVLDHPDMDKLNCREGATKLPQDKLKYMLLIKGNAGY
jgi:hypothetical protein